MEEMRLNLLPYFTFLIPLWYCSTIKSRDLKVSSDVKGTLYVENKCRYYSGLSGGGVDRHIGLNGQQYG